MEFKNPKQNLNNDFNNDWNNPKREKPHDPNNPFDSRNDPKSYYYDPSLQPPAPIKHYPRINSDSLNPLKPKPDLTPDSSIHATEEHHTTEVAKPNTPHKKPPPSPSTPTDTSSPHLPSLPKTEGTPPTKALKNEFSSELPRHKAKRWIASDDWQTKEQERERQLEAKRKAEEERKRQEAEEVEHQRKLAEAAELNRKRKAGMAATEAKRTAERVAARQKDPNGNHKPVPLKPTDFSEYKAKVRAELKQEQERDRKANLEKNIAAHPGIKAILLGAGFGSPLLAASLFKGAEALAHPETKAKPDPKAESKPDEPSGFLEGALNLGKNVMSGATRFAKDSFKTGVEVAAADLTPEMLATPEAKDPDSTAKSLYPVADAGGGVPFAGSVAPMLMAESVSFPSSGLSLPRLPALPEILPEAAKAMKALKPFAAPVVKGVSAVGGVILEGVLAEPAGGEQELEWERQNKLRQQQKQTAPMLGPPAPTFPVPPMTPTALMSVAPKSETKPNAVELQLKQQNEQWEQQQRQWERELKQQEQEYQQQQATFKVQQAAQKRLWAQQNKLSDLSSGFMLNQDHVETFEKQLTPQQRGAVQRAVNARYQDLMELAKQAGNPFEPDEVGQVKDQLRQQVLYERFVPVKEIYHFGSQFLNGYTPQKMQVVRGYFDQVFEGNYSKSIPADKRAAIVQNADARYVKETGKKLNRDDLLWKTLRNVEASEKYPDLWSQFRDDLSAAERDGVKKTIVNDNDPNLGANALNRPGQGSSLSPEILKPESFPSGEGQQKQQPVGGGFDNSVNPELLKPQEGFPMNEPVDGVTHVFTAKEGEIPGVDIPFRKVNPKYPANPNVLNEVKVLQDKIRVQRNNKYDCSEIAEDLLEAAKGQGKIIKVYPPKGKELILYEFGIQAGGFDYHQVYTDGQYVYDPRLSADAIPKGDWEIMIRSLNPDSIFK